MRAELQRLLEEGRGEDVVDDDLGADLVGEPRDAGDVDHLQRRVGRAFEEEDPGVLADGAFPVGEVAAVDQRAFDPVFRRQRLDHPAAGAEEGARGDDMVACLQLAEDGGGDGGHAGGRGTRVLGAFQHAHALFEHVVGRAAVAGVDEAVRLALEAGFGGRRRVIDEALREEDRLGGFAVLGAGGSAVNELGGRAPGLAHVHRRLQNKKTGRESRPVRYPAFLATCFTWLQAGRPNHHGINPLLLRRRACVNCPHLVLSGHSDGMGRSWLLRRATRAFWRTTPFAACSTPAG